MESFAAGREFRSQFWSFSRLEETGHFSFNLDSELASLVAVVPAATTAQLQGDDQHQRAGERRRRSATDSAVQDVSSVFSFDTTVNCRPLFVDVLPSLRVIAKSEDER